MRPDGGGEEHPWALVYVCVCVSGSPIKSAPSHPAQLCSWAYIPPRDVLWNVSLDVFAHHTHVMLSLLCVF